MGPKLEGMKLRPPGLGRPLQKCVSVLLIPNRIRFNHIEFATVPIAARVPKIEQELNHASLAVTCSVEVRGECQSVPWVGSWLSELEGIDQRLPAVFLNLVHGISIGVCAGC